MKVITNYVATTTKNIKGQIEEGTQFWISTQLLLEYVEHGLNA